MPTLLGTHSTSSSHCLRIRPCFLLFSPPQVTPTLFTICAPACRSPDPPSVLCLKRESGYFTYLTPRDHGARVPQPYNKSFGEDGHDMAARMDKPGFQEGRSVGKSSEREAGKLTQSLSLSVVQTSQGQEVQLGLVVPSLPPSRLLSSAASRGWGILVGPQSQYNSFVMLCFTTWL